MKSDRKIARRKLWLAIAVVALAGIGYVGWRGYRIATANTWDWEDVPASVVWLNTSKSAEAEEMRRRIAEGPHDLQRERAAARRAGIPLVTSDLQMASVPASRNAAVEARRLVALNKVEGFGEALASISFSTSPDRGVPTAEQVAAARAFLREHADAVALSYRIAERPGFSLERNWTYAEVGSPWAEPLLGIRTAAKILRAESLALASEGRYRDAARSQALGFRLAQHAASYPGLMPMLVGRSAESLTLYGLQDILQMGGPSAAIAAREVLNTMRDPYDVTRALHGEVLEGVAIICEYMRTGKGGGALRTLSDKMGATQDWNMGENVTAAGAAEYLRRMREIIAVTDLSRPERTERLARIYEEARRETPYSLMFNLNAPDVRKLFLRLDQSQALRGITISAAAVLSHRASTGAWPARLQDAMAKPPADPFAPGQPIGYRREPKGFVLYSVGESGRFAARPGQPIKGETLFRYPGP